MHPDTSPTPRTDEARHMAFDVHNGDYNAYVYIYTANHGETDSEFQIANKRALKLEAEVERFREALELIAAPMRPDGTYNRDRRACELLAKEALNNAQ